MRLIDADALIYDLGVSDRDIYCKWLIEDAPTIEERKTGKWIEISPPDENGNAHYECSVCGAGETHTPAVEVPYCWKCGAEMRGGKNV